MSIINGIKQGLAAAGVAFFISVLSCGAQQPVRFHNEASDTTRINEILGRAIKINDPQARVEAIARNFIGTPYAGGTLESEDGEILTVNLDEFDCTTFVETVVGLAYTAGEGRQSWRDFVYNLGRMRYRGGEGANGYSSRLHYVSDWIVDNTHRGMFDEVTNRAEPVNYEIKTLDFMTQNRNLYPALANDEEFEKMKTAEVGYRSHRYPMIKAQHVAKVAKNFLKNGDIIAITTGKKGLDVAHMGILVFDGKVPYLLHASSKEGKVIIDTLPLERYLQRYRHTGIRVIRLKE